MYSLEAQELLLTNKRLLEVALANINSAVRVVPQLAVVLDDLSSRAPSDIRIGRVTDISGMSLDNTNNNQQQSNVDVLWSITSAWWE